MTQNIDIALCERDFGFCVLTVIRYNLFGKPY